MLHPVCGAEAALLTSLRFAWQPVTGAESYLHCVARAGAECPQEPSTGSDWLVTYVAGDQRGFVPRAGIGDVPGDLDALAGQDLTWTVAACAAGRCTYAAQRCPLRIEPVAHELPAVPPAPIGPEDLEVISVHTPRVRLAWTEAARATGYRVCLQPDAEAGAPGCAGENAFRTDPIAATSTELELPAGFVRPGALVAWRVGACNRAGCRYSSPARRLSFTAAPPAPVLLEPAPDAIATETRPLLRWQGVPATDFYQICVAPPGVGCEEPTAVHHRHTGSRLEAELPLPLLPGRALAWTVAACTAGRCTHASPRRLVAPALASPAPTSPPEAAVTGAGLQRFAWDAAPLAEYYRLCVYDERAARAHGYGPAQACSALADAQTSNVHTTDAELPLDAADATSRELAWAVGACHHELRPECVYPRAARRLWVEPDHEVTISVESLEVNASCDEESAGDWIISVLPVLGTRPGAASVWPATGTRNARVGKTVRPGHEVKLEHVRPDATVGVAINVIDCDGDEAAAFRVPVARAFRTLAAPEYFPVRVNCAGEERNETGAAYEVVGTVAFELTPQQWRTGGKVTAASGGGDCGAGAFTATIGVRATPVATTLQTAGPDELPAEVWR